MTARIVSGEEAANVRTSVPRERDADVLAALIAGEVVHYDDLRDHFNSAHLAERFRRRLRTRQDGNGGRYYWTEPL